MSEHMSPIPSMIYNAAVGGHVTNSQQIIDENLNREQNDINQETVGAVPYNSTTPNGMGRIVLKKNDNFKQVVEAQTDGNTIFVIKYDFILTDNVTVPDNCIFKFYGGSISGAYTITGNNTNINARLVKILNTNVTLSGTWNVAEAYPEWFGAKGDGVNDDRLAIQKVIDSFAKIKLLNKTYIIGSVNEDNIGISISRYRIVSGSAKYSTTSLEDQNKSCIKVADNLNIDTVIQLNWLCELRNVGIIGSGVDKTNSCVSTPNNVAVSRITIENVAVTKSYKGFDMHTYLSNIKTCIASYCTIGFYFSGISVKNTSLTLQTCYAVNCAEKGYHFNLITYSTVISCAADGCGVSDLANLGYPYYLESCDDMTFISCGCENCMKVIYCNLGRNITFMNCEFCLNKYNLTLPEDYQLKDIVLIRYSQQITIYTCSFQTLKLSDYINSNSRLIYIYGNQVDYINLIYYASSTGLIDILQIGFEGGLTYRNVTYYNPSQQVFGSTAKRPYIKAVQIGFQYWDNTLGKPIWWNGSAWVDATGATV